MYNRIPQLCSKDSFDTINGHYLRISQPLVYSLLELTLFALSPFEQKPIAQNAKRIPLYSNAKDEQLRAPSTLVQQRAGQGE